MIARPSLTWKTSLALLLSSTCLPSSASAMPSVDLLFTELNGSAIGATSNLDVLPGDTVGVEMHVTSDDRGVVAYSLTVDFDSAATNRILLDGYATVLGTGFTSILGPGPQGPGDALGAPGQVRLFAAAHTPPGEPNPLSVSTTFIIATLEFTITNEILNGPATIVPGIFFTGVDEIVSNDLELIGGEFEFVPIEADFAFNFATLSPVIIPEPATALLLAGGLVALAHVRRRP